MKKILTLRNFVILIIVVLLSCFSYYPVHYEGECTVTALTDGHIALMQYDFTVYKSLFLLNIVRGNIVIEGREHGDIRQFEEKYFLSEQLPLPKDEYTFKERLEKKKKEWEKGVSFDFYGLYPNREDYPEMPGDPALAHQAQDAILRMHRLNICLNKKDVNGWVSWFLENEIGSDGRISSRGTGYTFTAVLE